MPEEVFAVEEGYGNQERKLLSNAAGEPLYFTSSAKVLEKLEALRSRQRRFAQAGLPEDCRHEAVLNALALQSVPKTSAVPRDARRLTDPDRLRANKNIHCPG